MIFPRRDRSAAATRLATIIGIAVILAGLWLLQRRQQESDRGVDLAPEASPTSTPAAPPPATPSAPPAAPTPAVPRESAAPVQLYDLSVDEARGGHTIARHVGRTDAQLRERLRRERGISAASTYTSQPVAERTVARTLVQNAGKVAAWVARSGNRPNLALDYRGAETDVLGRSLRRGSAAPVDCTNAIVVLRWDGLRGYFVLTSYPEAAR